mgnify:CR=1 FL=1
MFCPVFAVKIYRSITRTTKGIQILRVAVLFIIVNMIHLVNILLRINKNIRKIQSSKFYLRSGNAICNTKLENKSG